MKCDADAACEQHSTSTFRSYGPVTDDEVLARWILSPIHVRDMQLPGPLCDAAFSDLFTLGVSVQRIHGEWVLRRKEIHRRGEIAASQKRRAEKASGKPETRKYLGSVHLKVGAVRRAQQESLSEIRRMRVYGTAMRNDPAHAEIMGNATASAEKTAKVIRLELRTRLLDLALESGLYKSPYLSADDQDILGLEMRVLETNNTYRTA